MTLYCAAAPGPAGLSADPDTIAAIATAPGAGGIGIIRLSGPLARPVLNAVFRPTGPGFTGFVPRMLHLGRIVDRAGQELDDALVVFFPAPHSFTGEDTAEIQGHGGTALLHAILAETLHHGARLAERGEFTRRAFLHGRMDLTQAEAVAELIAAPSPEGVRLASAKLEGLLGQKVSALRERLEYLRQRVCLAIDFPDEEAECLPPAEFRAITDEVADGVRALLAGYQRARCWREGALVVLAGQVNVGKSSLMNALLGRPRAIVTEKPGTTRDYLEEETSLNGLPVRLVDTAGLRHANRALQEQCADPIELEGIRRGSELADAAQAVLVVLDGTVAADQGANAFDLEQELVRRLGSDRCLVVWNKADITPVPHALTGFAGAQMVAVSAKTGMGLDNLAAAVRNLCHAQTPQPEEIAPNLRQAHALEFALYELEHLAGDIENDVPPDVCSLRLETAAAHLADITGLNTTEDTLNAIFANFCIGK